MQEIQRGSIIPPPFAVRRWRGYDTGQVDGYLKRLAGHVARTEARLTQLQVIDQAALDVLDQAQRVAAETVAAAECHAEQLRQNAEDGLEKAQQDAFAMLDAARVEADNTVLSAREQAEAAIERGRSRVSELEAAGEARMKEFEQIVEGLRVSAVQSAAVLRGVGERLIEMAEHFEFKLATGGELIGNSDQGIINFDNATVEVI